ncbi:unnamed protein product [Diabrotica balteata]|uniref:Protein slit n=1 Tax=Diabrotica balteata TaxID=107213 RepID=A0A9N9SZR1_DIABA|nr:unnamed protein product [Diabrotica balteata]
MDSVVLYSFLLQVDNNQLTCIDDNALRTMKDLEILTLNNNNLTWLGKDMFSNMFRLRTLRLSENLFHCDCQLSWLGKYLRHSPRLAQYTRCHSPSHLKAQAIVDLQEREFKCSGLVERAISGECTSEPQCPHPCRCADGIVDCRQKGLTKVPDHLPDGITELRFEQNEITEIPPKAFVVHKRLRRIDLSNNKISKIAPDAFQGLKALTSLVLYGNKIKDLPAGVFQGLVSLQLLLLNANEISCIRKDTFRDLHSLSLLHLARNPFICDCNLKWLAEYLHKNPIETSGARCETPKRMQRRRIESLKDEKFKCKGQEEFRTKFAGECLIDNACPSGCSCDGTIVDCSGRELKEIPRDIPLYTTELNLVQNPFMCNCHLAWFSDWLKNKGLSGSPPRCAGPDRVKDVLIRELPKTEFKCLSDSDQGCLGENYCPPMCSCTGTVVRCSRANLKEIPRGVPPETSELYLDFNDIDRIQALFRILKKHTLSNYNSYSSINSQNIFNSRSLHGNQISLIPEGTFANLKSISHIALGSNPLYCDCSLKWLSDWVKVDYVEPGIAHCAEPPAMKDKSILSTPSSFFVCKGKVSNDILAKCDACYTFPCQNEGKCVTMSEGDFQCKCAPGYHGKKCEFMIDACYGNPCRNEGSCKVLEEGRFSCQCLPGFSGMRCEHNIDDCINNKCENNATCVDLIANYQCKCPAGFMGDYCERKIPFCTEQYNPCKNNARCVDHDFYYTCECLPGFKGENCTINVDDCENHMCQNGGTCVDGVNEYFCKCAGDYSGKLCEITPLVAMMYPQTSPCQHHDCVHGVCFQPSGSNDYLCKCAPGYSGKRCEYLTSLSFVHNTSYVELEPLRTKPEANVTIIFATKQENGILLYDGHQEHLAVELFNGRIRVSYDIGNYPVSTMYRVDRGLARSIINDGSKDYLRLTTPMYLGGIPPEAGHDAFTQWHLRNLTSFHGCMKEVWINHKPVDFGNAQTQQKVQPGCGIVDQDREEDEQEDEMDDEWSKNQPVRQTHALVITVRLICNDGTRYTKDIDIVPTPQTETLYVDDEENQPVHAPMTQDFEPEPATNQPYKLTFYYDNEKNQNNVKNIQNDAPLDPQKDYDGLVVQSYDSSFEGKKAARYAKDFNEHGTGCMLSAFLYFVTITSFVYLAILWIKQRMHMHVEQMQWW